MTRQHRGHGVALKRMIVEADLGGEPLLAPSRKFDVRGRLIRTWIEKHEMGEFDDEHVRADLAPEYEARIAALERLGGQAGARDRVVSSGARMRKPPARSSPARWPLRPTGVRVRGCELMNLARSTYCDASGAAQEDAIAAEIREIVGAFRGYGYRRVSAELRHRGQAVNSRKVRRIMRENHLSPKRKRRHVVTADSNRDNPVYPNLAPGFEVHEPGPALG